MGKRAGKVHTETWVIFSEAFMKIKILLWNVRRVNNLEKRKVIKQFIRDQRVDLVCLQETKVQVASPRLACSLGARRLSEWGSVDALGTAGGILFFWDKRTLDLVDMVVGVFFVSCLFRNVDDGFQWIFTGVYGSVVGILRENFWEELGAVRGLWTSPWCVEGDFNAITSSDESSKGGRVTPAMRRFFEVIKDLGLRNLPL